MNRTLKKSKETEHLVLFLITEEILFFNIQYDISCGFVIHNLFLYSYYEWVVNVIK